MATVWCHNDTTHTSHKHLVKLCCVVHNICRWNQELELQEWGSCKKYNKTIILATIVLDTNKNLQGYKEHDIYFISFLFGEKYVEWIANINIYV